MTLYVFALNTPVSVTLTDLSRAKSLTTGLPPLGDWLGLEALDTDRVELFPVADLGELPLSSYLGSAYDAETADDAARLDALDGSVLLVPAHAMTGTANPGPEATLIAALRTPVADHSAVLDPAPIPATPPEPDAEPNAAPAKPMGWIVAFALVLAVLIIWWLL